MILISMIIPMGRKKHLKIHPGVLSMHLSANHLATSDEGIPPTKFDGEKWGNSLILKCSEKSGLGRRTVDRWEILQTHQLRLRSYYATIYGPGFIATSKTGFASCHAVPRSKKKRRSGAKRTGFRLCLCQHPGGRRNHRPMFSMKRWKLVGGFKYFLFSTLLGEDSQLD